LEVVQKDKEEILRAIEIIERQQKQLEEINLLKGKEIIKWRHANLLVKKTKEESDRAIERLKNQIDELKHLKCEICTDEKDRSLFLQCSPQCNHELYCTQCLRETFDQVMNNMQDPFFRCPRPDCRKEVNIEVVRQVFDSDRFELFQARSSRIRRERNMIDVTCPLCNATARIERTDTPWYMCQSCHRVSCYHHRVAWHNGISCDQYDLNNQQVQESLNFIQSELQRGLMRQCSRCRHPIQKNQGCNHMTCRCGYEFFYCCGGDYRSGTHLGNCGR